MAAARKTHHLARGFLCFVAYRNTSTMAASPRRNDVRIDKSATLRLRQASEGSGAC